MVDKLMRRCDYFRFSDVAELGGLEVMKIYREMCQNLTAERVDMTLDRFQPKVTTSKQSKDHSSRSLLNNSPMLLKSKKANRI